MTFVKFFNGLCMPIVGLGTWKCDCPEELEKAVEVALEAGYRHFDTAYMNQNEGIIGNVLKRWIDEGRITREELYIVAKLPAIGMRPRHVAHFLQLSLTNLQLDYVDLYMIHSPIGFRYRDDTQLFPIKDEEVMIDFYTDLEAVWKYMEKLVLKGLTRSIGISNFSRRLIKRILKVATIQPACHQIELHAYYQRPKMTESCRKHNIAVVAYSPLGSPARKDLYGNTGAPFARCSLLENPLVREIAEKHDKSPAQIALKFLVQQNIVVIPKSSNPEHLRQNLHLHDFELSHDEMQLLETLDQGEAGRTLDLSLFPPEVRNHSESKEAYGN